MPTHAPKSAAWAGVRLKLGAHITPLRPAIFAFFGKQWVGAAHVHGSRRVRELKFVAHMAGETNRLLHQSFLPQQGPARALVWKYSPVNGGRRPRHFHCEPELNLICRGSATFGIGERVVKASAGELLGFPPGQDHVLLEASPDLYLYAIGMAPGFSAQVLRAEQNGVTLPLHLRLTRGDFGALAERAAEIVDQGDVDEQGAELWQHAHWIRHKQSSAMHVLTRRAILTIAEAPDLGLAALAKHLRANSSEVSRYFHRDVGMTLVQYRNRLRLLRFIDSADAGPDNLLRSAAAAGFGSYSQCHRIFQAELGCSPRQFFGAGVRQAMQLAYAP